MVDRVRERVFEATPIANVGSRVIASPFQFGVDGTDNLRVSVANTYRQLVPLQLPVVAVQGRFLTNDGDIDSLRYSFTAALSNTMVPHLFPLGVGYVQNLTVFVEQGSPLMGQVFVRVEIIRGFTGAVIPLGTILQGYITQGQGLSWPGSPIQHTTDIDGYVQYYSGFPVALGQPITITVADGLRQVLTSVATIFEAGPTVATRRPFLRFRNNSQDQFTIPHSATATAGQQIFCYWAQGLTGNVPDVPDYNTIALPTGPTLQAADVLQLNAINMQANDEFSATKIQVLERLEVL